MKVISISAMIVFLLLISSSWASDIIIEGKVQSYGCVNKKSPCPKDKDDPLNSFVHNYVLNTKEIGYYYVPNVAKAFLVKLINHQVRIMGNVYKIYQAIHADKIEIFKKSTWITTWSFGGSQCLFEVSIHKDWNWITGCKKHLYNTNLNEIDLHGLDLSNGNLSLPPTKPFLIFNSKTGFSMNPNKSPYQRMRIFNRWLTPLTLSR